MPVQRSTMMSRESRSNKKSHPLALFAAAMTILTLAMAAAFFPPSYAVASEGTSQEEGYGLLVLEEPHDKTQYATYEMAVGDVFSITFIHSVNKSPVTDYFEIREDGIYGIKTVYYGFGAGVPTELEEGQTLTIEEDGSMTISGIDVKLSNLIYRVGTVSDHTLTLPDESEISLRDLCGRNARVGFRFEMEEENLP